MHVDVATLAMILSLLFVTQVIVLAVQYQINRLYDGVGWWLAGASLMAVGFILMPLVRVPALLMLARIANPMVILGHLCLYLGILAFLGRNRSRWRPWTAAGGWILAYYYCMYIAPGIRGRTVVVSASIAWFALLCGYELVCAGTRRFSRSARFTAAAFLAYGLCFAVRTVLALIQPPALSYANLPPVYAWGFVVPIVTSTLWTCGFVLMLNQRLNAENQEERRTLERVVAELTQAQAALRDSEATYRSILEASPDNLTITGLDGRILLGSPMATAMFGPAQDRLAGLSLLGFVAPGDRDRARADLRLALGGSRTETHEYRGLRENGESFELEVRLGVIRGPGGEAAKVVFAVRDITGRKRMEAEQAELELRNRQLQKAESLGRMAEAITHHINNHMQVVLANLELAELLPAAADRAQSLARVKHAAERAIEVSKLMEAYLGQASPAQAPCRLADLGRACQRDLRATLPETIALELDAPAPGPVVMANAEQVRQILVGLVDNAREAIGAAQGRIRIGLRTQWAADLPVLQLYPVDWKPQAAVYASLEVADTGCGILPEHLEKLFDPFFSTKFTGRGLGLPMALGFVQAHGGAISVTSRPGQGSVFRAHFPVPGDPALMAPETAPAVPARG